MIFKEHTLNGVEWGCPVWNATLNVWQIEWFTADRQTVGFSQATPEAAAWINQNPDLVKAMQDKVLDWIIPF